MQGIGKNGEIHFFRGGFWEIQSMMANIFTLLFKHLTNFCLFVSFTQLGLNFVKLSMKLMKFLEKIIFISPKKDFIFCFVLFLFVFYVAGFFSLRTKITARFLLILILEVKLRNCFFFHQDFIFTCGLFRAFQGLFRTFLAFFRGLLDFVGGCEREIVNTPGRVKN